MRILIIVGFAFTAAACGRSGARADTAASQAPVIVAGPPAVPASLVPDSISGTVTIVGTSFDKQVMISVPGGQRRVEVIGAMSRSISQVAGAEVSAIGTLSGSKFEVTRFIVRAVDGQPAIDGTLQSKDGALYIVTTAGARTRIVAPPSPLVGRDGARVWITGDPAKGVSSFGFIDPER